jgi:glycosyltransferase involved in cell wall biosynthesis
MSARPRVAITLTQCWHRVPGGTSTSVLRLIRALEAGGRVDLVGVGPRGHVARPSSLRAGALPAGLPNATVARLALPLPLLYDAWSRVGRPSIEAVTGPVDLVHVTVPVRVPSGRAPIVATVHDVFPLTRTDSMTRRGTRLTRTGLGWIRDHASLVMVPSVTVAQQCVAQGFEDAKLRVVPWGAEVAVPDEVAVDGVLERYSLQRPYVMFTGTLEPRKNVAALLAAMTLLNRPDVTLVLSGPDGWGAGLGDELCGVPGPVLRTGFVPEEDLPALMRGAEAFVFPSLEEGFGLPVLEAMACGAAVVTSLGTATEEVAGDAARLVEPNDATALAGAIAGLLGDPVTASSLRDRAVRRAETFTWDRAARLTEAAYLEVAG